MFFRAITDFLSVSEVKPAVWLTHAEGPEQCNKTMAFS